MRLGLILLSLGWTQVMASDMTPNEDPYREEVGLMAWEKTSPEVSNYMKKIKVGAGNISDHYHGKTLQDTVFCYPEMQYIKESEARHGPGRREYKRVGIEFCNTLERDFRKVTIVPWIGWPMDQKDPYGHPQVNSHTRLMPDGSIKALKVQRSYPLNLPINERWYQSIVDKFTTKYYAHWDKLNMPRGFKWLNLIAGINFADVHKCEGIEFKVWPDSSNEIELAEQLEYCRESVTAIVDKCGIRGGFQSQGCRDLYLAPWGNRRFFERSQVQIKPRVGRFWENIGPRKCRPNLPHCQASTPQCRQVCPNKSPDSQCRKLMGKMADQCECWVETYPDVSAFFERPMSNGVPIECHEKMLNRPGDHADRPWAYDHSKLVWKAGSSPTLRDFYLREQGHWGWKWDEKAQDVVNDTVWWEKAARDSKAEKKPTWLTKFWGKLKNPVEKSK